MKINENQLSAGKFGYGNMVLGITAEPMQDAEARKRCLNSELANGRLAMMAILGLWVQDTAVLWPYRASFKLFEASSRL